MVDTLPETFFQLPKLQYLYLDKDKFTKKEQEEINQKLKGKFVYFE